MPRSAGGATTRRFSNSKRFLALFALTTTTPMVITIVITTTPTTTTTMIVTTVESDIEGVTLIGTASSPRAPAIPPPAASVVVAGVTGIVFDRLVPTGSFTLDDAVGVGADVGDCGIKTVFDVAAEIRDAVVFEIDGFRSCPLPM